MRAPEMAHSSPCAGRRRGAAVMLIGLLLIVAAPWDSTAKPGAVPAGAAARGGNSGPALASRPTTTGLCGEGSAPPPEDALFLQAVPDSQGTGMLFSAGGAGELDGTAFVNLGVGPGHNKGGYTMAYSATADTYIALVEGFAPAIDTHGSLLITTTVGFSSRSTSFYRTYVPTGTLTPIVSLDGTARLQPVSPDTFPTAIYVAVVASFAPPGPAPAGHRCVGSSYSVRASGALTAAERPLLLEMAYSQLTLAGADPHTLAIFAWDPSARRWDRLGGRLFYDPDLPNDPMRNIVSAATARFTTYALLATPAWRDEFDTLSGIDPAQAQQIVIRSDATSSALALASAPGAGRVVSRPIRPLTAIARWGELSFAGAAPPATTLTVDVLSLGGEVLMADVASGTSLEGISPLRHPALRLRATLTSAEPGQTPSLDRWQLTWEAGERAYLPLLHK